MNGVLDMGFSGAYTRLPSRGADCPGVLDYVFGSPSILPSNGDGR